MVASTTTRPTLPKLKTPQTASFPSPFPSELSARSARTPLSAFPDYIKIECNSKTPITPPSAYLDFLKSMASPVVADKPKSGSTTPSSAAHSDGGSTTSVSPITDDDHTLSHKSPAPSPFVYPTSAPSTSRIRLRIPPSPAFSLKDARSPLSANPYSAHPMSATSIRSPFSARSPHDWDIALKGRWFDVRSPKTSRGGVKQIREIVTRTVTYTPRMSAAPKGKRRKIE
ncbi:hypothetical protein VC83_05131 [Pseudogymnoascus destructans]|uniref:Uncharacterized protein n=2 Tax=Pseudogymnoascus destructans TaxID=655981 RepID=L8GCW6_PSED2|nr:uncharacterized protein VC83_05131 [Pseudogymnoascus destructans]ELR10538.1 hypothetical protein GMDG_04813 [Pseudogymnoascus destructans 20631-21]OAF58585.1 hypothetical protein VC83_05131 [Pseudogymnoascus destructans]